MKKILLACFVLFTVKAYSQKISYGISAGLDYTNLADPGTLIAPSYDNYTVGFHAGFLLDAEYKAFSVQPGILFTSKGGQYKTVSSFDGNTLYVIEKLIVNYVTIPVNVLFRVKAGTGSFFIGGGPFADIGFSAKYSSERNGEAAITHNYTLGGDGGVRRVDFGVGALAGYRLKLGFELRAGYSSDLTNFYNADSNVKNQGFNLSVGYFF